MRLGAAAADGGLTAERLAVRRGHATLFSNLRLSVDHGEALVISGPNGSGKTTLLRTLCGLTTPAEGEIRWRGQPMKPFDARLRGAVAFNGHLPALKEELTAAENLAAWIALDDRPLPPEEIAAALAAVSLDRQRDLPVRVLSQGQRRRIGVARLRLAKRPLWMLDEPLTALDAEGVELLGALLDAHLAAGGLCVAASHQALPTSVARLRSLALDAPRRP